MKIIIMDKDLTTIREVQLDFISVQSVNPIPRAIDIYNNENNRILLGTLGGEIFEIIFETSYCEGNFNPKFYTASHFSSNSSENNEITSILYWKSKDLFITTSEDSTIRFWNYKENRQENFLKVNIENPSDQKDKFELKPTAADISKNEDTLAIGLNTGSIRFYYTKDFKILKEINERKSNINVIKYSKDGKYIACASNTGMGECLDI